MYMGCSNHLPSGGLRARLRWRPYYPNIIFFPEASMKLLALFGTSLLLGLVLAAPTTDDDLVIVDKDFFPDELAVYTAEYDIVNILVPLNNLNFEDDEDDGTESDSILFFTQADKDADGKRVDKGLYILKNNQATKLLDHGREATADIDDSKTAYFGAKDGIYKYNVAENKAEKYGTLDDDIIGIAKVNHTDLIYILTEDHVLYKVTEEGTKKEKVSVVNNAQQIILDIKNNLFFYTPDKEIFVYNGDNVKKIEGLPANPSTVDLLKPPFVMENGIPVVMGQKSYLVYANGTSESGDFEVRAKPTAYSMESTVIQYYGYNKKIYEYNILGLILGELLGNQLQEYLRVQTQNIQSISTKNRVELRKGGL